MDTNEIKVFADETIEFIEQIISDRDNYKEMYESCVSGMTEQKEMIKIRDNKIGKLSGDFRLR